MGLGEVAPGGVGSGLYGMLVLAIMTVFVAGLMVGRTPEYLRKKITGREIKLVSLYILTMPLIVLIGTGIAMSFDDPAGVDAEQRAARAVRGALRVHLRGEQQRLGVRRHLGEHAVLQHRPRLRDARSVGSSRSSSCSRSPARWPASSRCPKTEGTLPTHGPLFVGMLTGVVIIVAGLTFFPVLALGPLAEGL